MDVEHKFCSIGVHLFDGTHIAVAFSMIVNGDAEFKRAIWHRFVKQRIVVHHCHPMEDGVLICFFRPLLEGLYFFEHGICIARIFLVFRIQVHVYAGHVEDQTHFGITLVYMRPVKHVHII